MPDSEFMIELNKAELNLKINPNPIYMPNKNNEINGITKNNSKKYFIVIVAIAIMS
jgi:hypothetical protein